MVEVIIRPVEHKDIDQIFSLAQQAGPGMTNFPPDKELLQQKIDWSLSSFRQDITEPGKEYYFFVLESLTEHKIVGTAAIFGKSGGEHPFYSYKISKEKVYSEVVGIDKWIEVLHLVHDFHESSEIGTLFLAQDYRRDKIGEFLSRVRFLFMACFRERFTKKIIAEMRGKIDNDGRSPFWDALCHHFFDMDFMTADKLCSMGKKQFITDVMPRCPIYVPLLSKKAQAVMGKVHANTKPALALLKKEGFRYEGYIDIFDAGATVEAPVEQLYSVRKSFVAPIVSVVEQVKEGHRHMLCNQSLAFRACIGRIHKEQDGGVVIERAAAEAIGLKKGDTVRAVRFPLPKKPAVHISGENNAEQSTVK